MIADLRCPVCGEAFAHVPGGSTGPTHAAGNVGPFRCARGHHFDLARQGYLSLLSGRSGPRTADTAEMVAARLRVHAAGVLDRVVDAVAEVGASLAAGTDLIVDLGGGPGAYLRPVLRRCPDARGLVVDLSRFCARAVTRGDPPAAAVVADIWRAIPVRTAAAGIVLSVFAPRNAAEIARILGDDGHLLVVAPLPDHLGELIEPLGMLSVAPDKRERIEAALGSAFTVVDRIEVRDRAHLAAPTIADLVAMGPSAFHHDRADLDAAAHRVAGAGRVEVTVAVTVTTYQKTTTTSRTTGQRSDS
ncbi:MAG: methyltransferase [Gordonia sp. (in: high G+C Gram-positive bacteria)]